MPLTRTIQPQFPARRSGDLEVYRGHRFVYRRVHLPIEYPSQLCYTYFCDVLTAFLSSGASKVESALLCVIETVGRLSTTRAVTMDHSSIIINQMANPYLEKDSEGLGRCKNQTRLRQ